MYRSIVHTLGLKRIGARGYATVVKHQPPVPRKTLKDVNSRKTFLIDYYADLMRNNEMILFAHQNSLLAKDDQIFRKIISDAGGQLVVINKNFMKVYLRNEHDADPALAENYKKNLKNKHPLFPLLNGPTALILFRENDPTQLKKVMKGLNAAKERLFVVGARINTEIYDLKKVHDYKDLPSLPELQGQLVGLLNILGGYGLTRTLEAASNVLYLTLKSHHDNVENPKKPDEERAGKQ